MPIYEYHCLSCGKDFEQHERLRDHGQAAVACPHCRAKRVERVFTSFYAKTIRKS